jgi:hypothetical protein
MSVKTDVQLKANTDAVVVVNGNREITPPLDNALRTDIIDSKVNVNGGNVIVGLVGYTTELTPSDNKHLATKKYVDDSVNAIPILTEGDGIDITSEEVSLDLEGYSTTDPIDITTTQSISLTAAAGFGLNGIVAISDDLTLSNLTASQLLELNGSKEVISVAKGTAHNKNFGTTAGTVAAGNDTRFLGLVSIYTPEMYGAVGDGVTDDTAAFGLIPAGAKLVRLTQGATYLISDEINIFSSNTILEGNYATIKRANAVKTELAAAAALGATSITVVDATGFQVGDYFTITNNAAVLYAGKGDQENSNRGGDLITISSIVGNVITFNNGSLTGLQLPENGELDGAGQYPIGSNVIRTFNMWGLGVANDNIEIRNLIIDGNVTGNDYTYDWRVNNTGSLKGTNILISGCHFINLPSENITVSGQVRFDSCYLSNTTGGICHCSTSDPTAGTNGYWITNCKGVNVTQRSAQAGHSDSFITFSASVQEVWAVNNNIQNDLGTSSGYIIGAIGFTAGLGDDYSDCKIRLIGGRYKNFQNISTIFSNTGDLNQNVFDIGISGDIVIENCGDLLVRGNEIADGGGVRKVKIKDATITNGRIFLEQVYDVKIINVDLLQEESFSFADSIVGLSNVNTVGHLYVKGSRIKIKNCDIIGKSTNDDYCKRGIFFTSNTIAKDSGGVDTNYGYFQEVIVSGNTVKNHHEYEIATSDQTTSTARTIELVGWSVKNNHVYAQKDSTSETAMLIDPGVTCEGNKVYTYLSGQTGITALGIHTSGPITLCKGAIARNNEVWGLSATPIRVSISSNTYNAVVSNNFVQVEFGDASVGKSYAFNNSVIYGSSTAGVPGTLGTPHYINEDEDSDEY